MNVEKQGSLTTQLSETRRRSHEILERVRSDAVVNAGGWRVKDVIVHLTVWETEISKSTEACLRGGTYIIPDFSGGDEFNREVFERGYNEAFADVLNNWSTVRQKTLKLIEGLSEGELAKEVVCPWDGRESLHELAESISAHEAHHLSVVKRVALNGEPFQRHQDQLET